MELSSRYGGTVYESYQALLADPAIDAVSVCSANVTHAEITIAALKAGKHVLCEKPMATPLEDCQAMVDTAKACGRFLMVGHNQRLAKAHIKAREMITQGAIGKVLTFRTIFAHSGPENWAIDGKQTWFFDKKSAMLGAMADLGIHKTDLIQYLTGQKVKEVQAFVSTIDKRGPDGTLVGVDDNAVCIFKMGGGAVGTMTASWTNYGREENSTVLYGTDGVMRLYADPNYSMVVESRDGQRTFYEIDQIQTNDRQTKSGVIDLFMDALINRTQPEISGEDALCAMKAVFAAMESAKTGKTVTVEG
jgi:predicted dehydrogenase